MSEPTSHICPECSTPRASDGTPSCACGRRASEALLEVRTAEAAAAEDFDPLRIRPYVELGGDGGGDGARGGHDKHDALTIQQERVDPFRTQRSPSPAAEATGAARASGAGGPAGATTTVLAPFEDDAFASSPSPSPASSARRDRRRRRRRTGIIVALAGTAAAGVMAAAGFMSGLFSYDAPERDGALPDDLRASAPDTSADGDASPVEPSEEDAAGAPAPAPTGEAPPPSPTPTPSSSPSPTRSSASPSASPDPTRSSPSASASGGSSAAGSEESDSRLVVPKTLRAGDDDPEVTELQLRLRQLDFYNGDIDENYNSQVELAVCAYQESRNITKGQEEPGVYGPVTRERLESETKEP